MVAFPPITLKEISWVVLGTLTLVLCVNILTPASLLVAQELPPDALQSEEVKGVAFEGRLRESGNREPLRGVMVVDEATGAIAFTDLHGRFSFTSLRLGPTTLRVDIIGQGPLKLETVVSLEQKPVDFYVQQGLISDAPIIVTDVEDGKSVGERRIEAAEIRQTPGAMGDPVRALQNMPGVAWSPLGLGLLIVRGNNPEDSGFFLDGLQIPQVYHFLGVRTLVNAPVLQSVRFYPGGFGVRYGRVLGGIIDLETKEQAPSAHHGKVSVDLLDSSIYSTGPLGPNTDYTLSLRRSYVDTFLEPVLELVDVGYRVIPFYWDYVASVSHRPSDNHRFRVMVVGSRDRLEVFGEAPLDAEDEAAEALIDYATDLKQVRLEWEAFLGARTTSELTMAVGPQPNEVITGDTQLRADSYNISMREELRYDARDELSVIGGLDMQIINWDLFFDYDDQEPYEDSLWTVSPSTYVEANYRPFTGMTIVSGLRFESLLPVGQDNFNSLDPRFMARWQWRQGTVFKGSLGRFSAFPDVLEYIESLGTPNLSLEHSVQGSLGVEQALPFDLTIDAVGYYNRYRSLVIANEIELSTSDLAELDESYYEELDIYSNAGQGRAYGLEMMLRRSFGSKLWGWLSYSIQRSERRDSEEADYVLFDYDQTHLLTLLGVYELPKNWSLGGRFRYGTGRPYDPVIGRTYSLDSRRYSPIYGEENSARYPDFHSLDIRVERSWTYNRWALSFYLDLQNAYNQQNAESHYYSWDYVNLYYIAGLPVIPAIGLQGDW